MMNEKQIFRPFAFAVHQLVSGVLDGSFPQGSTLPAERMLAKQLGITRPTLREALQVLATEGWFKIQHGKPTQVTHYLNTGNLALLSRLASYPQWIPKRLTVQLLEVRIAIMPQVARLAWNKNRSLVLAHLAKLPDQGNSPADWVIYDWDLQLAFLEAADNPIFKMIFNGFENLFKTMCMGYFSNPIGRMDSQEYYTKLLEAKTRTEWVEIVSVTMCESVAIWEKMIEEKNREEL